MPIAASGSLPKVKHAPAVTNGRQEHAAQFALGWLLAQKPWIVPIPGTTNPRHLEENLGGAAVELSPAELAEIRAAIAKIPLTGVRAPESALKDQ